MGILRAEIIAKIRGAIKEGKTATSFYWELRKVGPVTRKTVYLADWRNEAQLEEKKDLLKYVRKDRYPTERIIATTTYKISKEFMYVVKVKTQIRPDEPVEEHNVNIQTDAPMTPAMMIERVIEERAKEEKYFGEILISAEPWMAIRRVTE